MTHTKMSTFVNYLLNQRTYYKCTQSHGDLPKIEKFSESIFLLLTCEICTLIRHLIPILR